MILLRQVRKILLIIGLAVFISTASTFGFASGESWAVTLSSPGIRQLPVPIATMNQAKAMTKNIEGKAQEEIGSMTGDLKTQATGKAKQLEAKTRKGTNRSIENPNYQPGGTSKQAEEQSRDARKAIEDEVRDAFQ
ncbi:CsbD family protein [Stenomitos frigidus]|uniref:CsbD family protein n=1 Tax=Stenomitos frigidus TaxID=1886765 RepID=UPI0015E7479C|nr:CsbD family protein [Stenomitos frigidus]